VGSAGGCDQPATFPPVSLPDPAALAKIAAGDGSGLLRHFAALSAWVGEAGRPVDDRGDIRKGDRGGLLAALGLPAMWGLGRRLPRSRGCGGWRSKRHGLVDPKAVR
jgi:hypothetical protein